MEYNGVIIKQLRIVRYGNPHGFSDFPMIFWGFCREKCGDTELL